MHSHCQMLAVIMNRQQVVHPFGSCALQSQSSRQHNGLQPVCEDMHHFRDRANSMESISSNVLVCVLTPNRKLDWPILTRELQWEHVRICSRLPQQTPNSKMCEKCFPGPFFVCISRVLFATAFLSHETTFGF